MADPAFGSFPVPEPELKWLVTPNELDRDMEFLNNFAFKGPTGDNFAMETSWAKKGDEIGGASFPKWVPNFLLGGRTAYVGDHRRATAIHDALVKTAKDAYHDITKPRPPEDFEKLKKKREKADLVMLFACLAGDCKSRVAFIMYFAVAYRTAKKTQAEEDADKKDEEATWGKKRKAKKAAKEFEGDYENQNKKLDLNAAKKMIARAKQILG